MARDESSVMNALGAALFCGLSLLSLAGWGYMFLNEQYPNLSKFGEMMAIGLGIGLAPMWMLAGTWLMVSLLQRLWKPHPVWIVVCILTGMVGGVANLFGWATFLGPAV